MKKRETALSLLAEGLGLGSAFYLVVGVLAATEVVNGPPDFALRQLRYAWPALTLEAAIVLALLLVLLAAAWLVQRRGLLAALRRVTGAFGIGAAKGMALVVSLPALCWLFA